MNSIYVGLLNLYIIKNCMHAKYIFAQTQVKYLGHIISGGVIAVDPAKRRAIMDWPKPTCVKPINSFLG